MVNARENMKIGSWYRIRRTSAYVSGEPETDVRTQTVVMQMIKRYRHFAEFVSRKGYVETFTWPDLDKYAVEDGRNGR